MKKKSGSRIGRVITRIINIRFWFDWDRMKAFTVALKNGIKRMFVPQQAVTSESFNAAKTRMHLSDAELLSKQNALFRLSILMLAVAILLLGYGGYQIFYGSLKAVIVSLVVTLIALVLAFRYHFWYFQIKHRKLGCTFNEWYRQGLLGEKE
ncbi:type IVB secretion system protein IcmV [Legionella fallonii]|uniref:Component of the Dot/Icm secretion system n=1 Tax=Legionella fallonii LLAP-10 TaxID=1212491 RepID=A0A098G1I5_9GAMM|nr:type IVB secretion system protein IcmV [Legionella fallonii]CEG55846.1 Component of the Dot/Icm secretion system [Legionella fallonii LLAP-10]